MIQRDLFANLEARLHRMEALLLWGPRQTGKTTLLENLSDIKSKAYLDDFQLRSLAEKEPSLFLNGFSTPLLIDECSYSPNLFPELKLRIDKYRREKRSTKNRETDTYFYLTSSNKANLDQHVKESLAGRIQIYSLSGLSVSEILNFNSEIPIRKILFCGGLPELYARDSINVISYLNDYITSFIEKDIGNISNIDKRKQFLDFLKILSGRTSQFINFSEIANIVGVTVPTIQHWCEKLESNQIIHFLPTYSNNLTKRVVKMKKMFFFDTGVAVRLQGHTNEETLWTSPQSGFAFESLVLSEVFKIKSNYSLEWNLFTWRTKEKEEIDLVLEIRPNRFILIESKLSDSVTEGLTLSKEALIAFGDSAKKVIVSPGSKSLQLSHETHLIPISQLKQFLLQEVSQSQNKF